MKSFISLRIQVLGMWGCCQVRPHKTRLHSHLLLSQLSPSRPRDPYISTCLPHLAVLLGLIRAWRWKHCISSKHQEPLAQQHCITSQKTWTLKGLLFEACCIDWNEFSIYMHKPSMNSHQPAFSGVVNWSVSLRYICFVIYFIYLWLILVTLNFHSVHSTHMVISRFDCETQVACSKFCFM
jgi:hypothetical protein